VKAALTRVPDDLDAEIQALVTLCRFGPGAVDLGHAARGHLRMKRGTKRESAERCDDRKT
jgi:hypothetical protein